MKSVYDGALDNSTKLPFTTENSIDSKPSPCPTPVPLTNDCSIASITEETNSSVTYDSNA